MLKYHGDSAVGFLPAMRRRGSEAASVSPTTGSFTRTRHRSLLRSVLTSASECQLPAGLPSANRDCT